jgi:hypothetical protein
VYPIIGADGAGWLVNAVIWFKWHLVSQDLTSRPQNIKGTEDS